MTKADFKSRTDRYNRSVVLWTLIWLPLFFGALFANVPLSASMDHASARLQVLYGIVFFGFLVAQFPLMYFWHRSRVRKFGLACPHCRAQLVKQLGQIALASGNCGQCGEAIVGTEDTEPSPRN